MLRQQLPQLIVLVVRRAGREGAHQRLVEPTELGALIDELLSPIDISVGAMTSAANNKDDQLRELLAQHGITFQVNPPQPGPPPGPAASGKE